MPTESLNYSTPAELKQIEQTLLPTLVEDDPIFGVFPIVESDRVRLRWVQRDNYTGLQQIRGLNGQPKNVRMTGYKEYEYKPGYYGEFVTLDEAELTERRKASTWDEPASVDDLVGDAQTFLLQRRLDRIRYIIFTLITTGVFSVANGRGEVMHQDAFSLQTLTAGIAWSSTATAVPTTNIRAAQLLSRGQSVNFGTGAEIWMNQTTANNLLSNTNANDLFGRRVGGGDTVNNLGDINKILSGNNLPEIVVYDRFYLDDSNQVQLFIPNNKAVLIGKRSNNAQLGEYRMTRNRVNNGKPGAYTQVVDTLQFGQIPGAVHVHDGHNGGPVIEYPGAIVVMNV